MSDQPVEPTKLDDDAWEGSTSSGAPGPGTVEPTPNEPLEQAPPVDGGVTLTDHDEEDVKAALERETQDGSGLENDDPKALPAGDFDSFATDDVEVEE